MVIFKGLRPFLRECGNFWEIKNIFCEIIIILGDENHIFRDYNHLWEITIFLGGYDRFRENYHHLWEVTAIFERWRLFFRGLRAFFRGKNIFENLCPFFRVYNHFWEIKTSERFLGIMIISEWSQPFLYNQGFLWWVTTILKWLRPFLRE